MFLKPSDPNLQFGKLSQTRDQFIDHPPNTRHPTDRVMSRRKTDISEKLDWHASSPLKVIFPDFSRWIINYALMS
jgi:hypothetical protein